MSLLTICLLVSFLFLNVDQTMILTRLFRDYVVVNMLNALQSLT